MKFDFQTCYIYQLIVTESIEEHISGTYRHRCEHTRAINYTRKRDPQLSQSFKNAGPLAT